MLQRPQDYQNTAALDRNIFPEQQIKTVQELLQDRPATSKLSLPYINFLQRSFAGWGYL
jgi:hypothetical protein